MDLIGNVMKYEEQNAQQNANNIFSKIDYIFYILIGNLTKNILKSGFSDTPVSFFNVTRNKQRNRTHSYG